MDFRKIFEASNNTFDEYIHITNIENFGHMAQSGEIKGTAYGADDGQNIHGHTNKAGSKELSVYRTSAITKYAWKATSGTINGSSAVVYMFINAGALNSIGIKSPRPFEEGQYQSMLNVKDALNQINIEGLTPELKASIEYFFRNNQDLFMSEYAHIMSTGNAVSAISNITYNISKGFCDWMDSLYLGKSRRSFNPKINIPASLPLNVKNSIIKKIQTHFPNSTQEQIDEMIKKTYTSWRARVENQQFTQAFYNVFNHFSTAPQGYKVGNLRANNKVGEERFDLTKSGIPLDPKFVRIKIYVNDVKDLFNVHFLKQAIPLLKEKPQLLDAPKFNKVSSHLKDVLTIIDKEELLSLTPESFKQQQS